MTRKAEWARVWRSVRSFAHMFPNDTVAIGGIAVYLHSLEAVRKHLPIEYTHDADFVVGRPSWSDIQDQYETTVNRRLSKFQITINDVEFDLYLERTHNLRVDFIELSMNADEINGIHVADKEHLLLLKFDALHDRYESSHGAKDRRDVVKLLILLAGTKPYFLLSEGTKEDMKLLDKVMKSTVFMDLGDGNAHTASKLRKQASIFVDALKKARR